MIKIAIVTDSEIATKDLKQTLIEKYVVEKIDENMKNGLFVTSFVIKSTQSKEIEETLEQLKIITGIDLSKKRPGVTKSRKEVRVRRIACYLLRYRLGLSYQKIAKALGYASHCSILIHCRRLPRINVSSNILLEKAIRRTLKAVIE